jgi:hypothetical protein
MSQDPTNPLGTENNTAKATEGAARSIVGTLLDLGAAWAAHGLHAGKFSLENSARALEKTAKTLENIAREFEKKSHTHDS